MNSFFATENDSMDIKLWGENDKEVVKRIMTLLYHFGDTLSGEKHDGMDCE